MTVRLPTLFRIEIKKQERNFSFVECLALSKTYLRTKPFWNPQSY
ncbi:1472_t:CDS:2 [Cetraspora pellucida]|uniref:1472_t:CDS:1 n=1 Tax=Cetraspora pellucida TaxID=1433469 RepID=A0A9N9G6B0_9GLOM|nr:1472_t:CDS:2 [Cetraspora pellucida]